MANVPLIWLYLVPFCQIMIQHVLDNYIACPSTHVTAIMWVINIFAHANAHGRPQCERVREARAHARRRFAFSINSA
jgi:hypothetical protein